MAGADELTFLDVTASSGNRETTFDVVRRTAEEVFIPPLTVGGGVRGVAEVDKLLRFGADKASINTAAVARPDVIDEITRHFGSQVLVLSVDARRTREGDQPTSSGFEVTTTVAAPVPESTPLPGPRKQPIGVWEKSCSTRSTRTAPRTDSISN